MLQCSLLPTKEIKEHSVCILNLNWFLIYFFIIYFVETLEGLILFTR